MLLEDLRAALGLLTRLPVGAGTRPPTARAVWAYPLVGLLIGALGGLVNVLLRSFAVPDGLAALWALGATMLATGAMHEDGLADSADGLGGGLTRARKLEIMRDSRIGGFGALALVMSVGIRTAAVASLSAQRGAVALIVAGGAGRAAIVVVLAVLRPARADGMAAGLGRHGSLPPVVAWTIALAAAWALLPWQASSAVVIATALVALAIARTAHRQVGGHTGDILGASEQLTQAVVLTVLAALLRS